MLFKVICILSIISLSSCFIKEQEIDEDAKEIDFSNQGIIEISTLFSDYSELTKINLSNNTIEDIEPDIFIKNTKLKRVDLSGNKNILISNEAAFLKSNYVEELILANCNLQNIPAAFDELTNLKVLDLSNNPIDFEESLFFQIAKAPPKQIIISSIKAIDLRLICKKIDAEIIIKDDSRTVNCAEIANSKDVLNEEIVSGNELDSNVEMIEEGLMMDDTHMEIMMADEPLEGSGDEPEILVSEDNKASKEDSAISKEDDDKVGEDTSKEEEDTNAKGDPKIEEETSKEEDTNAEDDPKIGKGGSKEEGTNSKSEESSTDYIKTEDAIIGGDAITTEEDETKTGDEENLKDVGLEIVVSDLTTEIIIKDESTTEEIVTTESAAITEKVIVPIFNRSRGFARPNPPQYIEETPENKPAVETVANEENAQNTAMEGGKMQRIIIDDPNKQTPINTISAVGLDNESIAPGKKTEKASGSSSVILFLVIGVVAIGSVAVIYKCVQDKKKAQYNPVNTRDASKEGKELQEIKINQDKPAEVKPLINERATVRNGSMEFKEVIDTKENAGTKIDAKVKVEKLDTPKVEKKNNGEKSATPKNGSPIITREHDGNKPPRSLSVNKDAFE